MPSSSTDTVALTFPFSPCEEHGTAQVTPGGFLVPAPGDSGSGSQGFWFRLPTSTDRRISVDNSLVPAPGILVPAPKILVSTPKRRNSGANLWTSARLDVPEFWFRLPGFWFRLPRFWFRLPNTLVWAPRPSSRPSEFWFRLPNILVPAPNILVSAPKRRSRGLRTGRSGEDVWTTFWFRLPKPVFGAPLSGSGSQDSGSGSQTAFQAVDLKEVFLPSFSLSFLTYTTRHDGPVTVRPTPRSAGADRAPGALDGPPRSSFVRHPCTASGRSSPREGQGDRVRQDEASKGQAIDRHTRTSVSVVTAIVGTSRRTARPPRIILVGTCQRSPRFDAPAGPPDGKRSRWPIRQRPEHWHVPT